METNKSVVFLLFGIIVSQLILIILKLTNVINWSWGWVFSPLWVPYLLSMLAGIILVIYLFAHNLKERIFRKHG